MSKKYDIVATVGKYTNSQGQEKSRYKNVGAILEGKDGLFMVMDKTFNPAGLAQPDRDSIILSLYEPKDDNAMDSHNEAKGNGYQPQDKIDDQAPF